MIYLTLKTIKFIFNRLNVFPTQCNFLLLPQNNESFINSFSVNFDSNNNSNKLQYTL